MPAFLWEARTRNGETRNGTMVADTAEAGQQRLRAQALSPQVVKKKPIEIKIPITIAGMSFGSLSAQAKEALGRGASMAGTSTTTGDGGSTDDTLAVIRKYQRASMWP